ncbi:tail fiber protein [Cellulophaga sp. BC115SP]|uniref:tail fiber protein n=1 Tax=Cellulophaga sp. BC115SP TaxID=2683263 RepID=UPI0014131447|nr:hypothetical protein [Cellulophaga sp. BC115SP]
MYNWAFCDGRLLKTRQESGLFALLGPIFGGNMTDNFALPKLPNIPNPKNPNDRPIRYIICVRGRFPF